MWIWPLRTPPHFDRNVPQVENLALYVCRVKLRHFAKFSDMTEALSAATAAVEGKMSKRLKKVLKKVYASEVHEQLAVADAKLGSVIKVSLGRKERVNEVSV